MTSNKSELIQISDVLSCHLFCFCFFTFQVKFSFKYSCVRDSLRQIKPQRASLSSKVKVKMKLKMSPSLFIKAGCHLKSFHFW